MYGRAACPGAALGPVGRSQLQRLVAVLVVCNVVAIAALMATSVGGRVQREQATIDGPALSAPQLRGLRGATTAFNNTAGVIHDAVEELLREMMRRNSVRNQDVTEAIFAVTPDLTAAFAATAARTRVGLEVPLFGTQEAVIDGGPLRCIRVLLHARSSRPQRRIEHVYLRGAALLRDQVPGVGAVTSGSGGGVGDAGKSVLDRIRRRGALLVGSTGDYPPFTFGCTSRHAPVSPTPASSPLCTDRHRGDWVVVNSSSTNLSTVSSSMQV